MEDVAPAVAGATFLGINEVQAILLTATVAASIAVWGILSQRAITARQVTLNFIRESEADNDIISARQLFNDLAMDGDGLGKWARDEHAKSKEAQAIRLILNEQELIAIAIQRGILDDTTYRRFFKSGVIKTWKYAAPYVLARRTRTGNVSLYHEFEELARYYRGQPPLPQRRFFWGKYF